MTEGLRIEVSADGTRRVIADLNKISAEAADAALAADRLKRSVAGAAGGPGGKTAYHWLKNDSASLAVAQSRAAREAGKLSTALKTQASEANAARGHINRLGASLVAALGVREALALGDGITEVRNKLAAVAKPAEDVADNFDRLRQIAKDTRVSLAATATGYSRLAVISEELGKTQEDVFEFTTNLNKAVKVSGASSTEATNAIIQLTQGLGAGALRGDELRSVLEQLPTVADLIAKEFGVTRGELKRLGEAGALSGKRVFDAIQKADGINEKFARTVPTVGEKIQALKDDVGELTEGFTKLAGSIVDVVNKAVNGFNEIRKFSGQVSQYLQTGEIGVELTGRALERARIEREIERRESLSGKLLGVDGTDVKGAIAGTLMGRSAADLAVTSAVPRLAFAGDDLDALKEKLAEHDKISNALRKQREFTDKLAASQEAETRTTRDSTDETNKNRGARDDLLDRFRAFENGLNDQLAAQRELQEAIALVDRALSRGLIGSMDEANGLINQYADSLRDRLNPELKIARERTEALAKAQLEVAFAQIAQGYESISDAIGQGTKDVEEMVQAWKNALGDEQKGPLDQYLSNLRNVQGTMENGLVSAAQELESALVRAFTSGDQSATDFLRSLAAIGMSVGLRGLAGSAINAFREGGTRELGHDGMLHAQTGLGWTMPGTGGPDSRIVPLAMTPGERLTVETPGQQARNDNAAGMTVQAAPAQVFVIDDLRKIEEFILSPRGRQAVMSVWRTDPAAAGRYGR